MAVASNGKTILASAAATDQLLSGGSWSSQGTGTTVTYSFMANAPAAMPEDTGGFSTFSAKQITAAQLAMQGWSDVANIRFNEVFSTAGGPYSDAGTIRFANYSSGESGAAAFTYLPANYPYDNRSASSLQGDGWYNSTLGYNANPQVYGYGQQVLVHEIGHALGLSHPSNYDVGGTSPVTYAASAGFFQDSRQYTVMSYFSESNTGGDYVGASGVEAYASAPQLLDIAAAQALYGANMSAFLGDTVYGFNSNANRPWFTASSATSSLVFSVWDAGGNNTFDFSGYRQAQLIDLNAGDFSNVGGMTGNVSIAYGTRIDNAIGGTGVDTIVANVDGDTVRGMDGNDSLQGGGGADYLNGNRGDDVIHGGGGLDTLFGGQGNDTIYGDAGRDLINGNMGDDVIWGANVAGQLYGGQGNDTIHGGADADTLSGDLGADLLYGGAGADRFVFRAGDGADWIADFNSAEGDRIVLPAGATFTITSYQNQAVIHYGNGDVIGLVGVSVDQMGAWLATA